MVGKAEKLILAVTSDRKGVVMNDGLPEELRDPFFCGVVGQLVDVSLARDLGNLRIGVVASQLVAPSL